MASNLIHTAVPTIVVHGGAGIYATIVHDNESKKDIEDGILEALVENCCKFKINYAKSELLFAYVCVTWYCFGC
jgi:hypothetical protein